MERAMTNSALPAAFRHRLARLADDCRGVSAVEFAMLLPLLVTLYFGTVEISQALSIDRKATQAARVAADLVTQATTLSNADVTGIFEAAKAMVTPYPTTTLSVVVSAVNIDGTGKATIGWSDTLNGTARTVGSTVTLPTGLAVNNTQLIWSEVVYTYTPTIGYVITGSIPLKDQIYMRPRLSDTVARTS
jgi:Flp pilus assembly protein TadG